LRHDLQAGIPFLFVDLRAVRPSSTLSSSRNGPTVDPARVGWAMIGGGTMRRLAIGIAVLALSSYGVAALTVDPADDLSPAGSPAASVVFERSDAPAQAVESPLAPMPVEGRAHGAPNPLWSVPLTALSGTRERPIFSSTRRPRPPAVAVAPVVKPVVAPKPKDPEHPKLTLIGTVTGGVERFGIFLDQTTKAALRLKMGDDYQGWTLRSVEGREATLEKEQEAVILALPQPSDISASTPITGTVLSAALPSRRERSSH
jgi:general secretion pathway protein N